MLIGGNEFKLLSKVEQENIINSIKHYYFDTILCRDEICELLNIKMTVYKKIIHDNNWKRSKQRDYECQKRIKKIRYGYENPWQDVENIKQSYIKYFGVDNPQKSKKVKEKSKQTKLERYGDENYNNRNKAKETNLMRYGFDNPIKCSEVKEKIKQTNLKRYGVENSSQSKEIKEKIKQSNKERYGGKSWQYVDFSDETKAILKSKEAFIEFLESVEKNNRTVMNISKKLNIAYTTSAKYIHEYDCVNLITYDRSECENDICTYMKQFASKLLLNDRQVIVPLEIDIFVPEFNFGIEFNGDYWHSEIYKENNYHQDKSLKAKENGTFIYHIFEHEWNDERKQEIIKSQLRNLCHRNEIKIYARNCEIREISNVDLVRSFLNKNHLQGFRNSKIKLGLFYNNELVSLMTFGEPYLNKSNKYEWELYRFCNKLNTTVVGGFNKLITYFIAEYSPKSILTYSNFAKGSGSIYKNVGFECLELTKPNYVWWRKNNLADEIISRYQTQMKDEVNIMKSKGYARIFDCGNYKWVLNLL